MRRVFLIAALAACGHGSSTPPEPVRHEPPTTSEAQPAGADDLVVARVDGRPVYGSCVAAQARALGLDVRAALDQCVRFELLAGAAEAGGYRNDPEVAETWRREMVRALIEKDLGAIQSIDELPPELVRPMLERAAAQIHRPEIRIAHYTRATVPKKTPEGAPEDLAAKAVADRIYAELSTRDGILPDELHETGTRLGAGTGVTIANSRETYAAAAFDVPTIKKANPAFRDALFAIPSLGHVSPPTRTAWGWDIVLWWDVWPPTDQSAQFFTTVRERYFAIWAKKIASAAGVTPAINETLLVEISKGEAP
jgi:hypothetical protein